MHFELPPTIKNLYDSHVHWLFTGQLSSGWNLKEMSSPEEILKCERKKNYFQGEWLVGFGWDENRWQLHFTPHRKFLDSQFPDVPVLLSRVDGHSSWVNTAALKKLGLWNEKIDSPDIVLDEVGLPTGVLKESAHIRALQNLPQPNREQKKASLIAGGIHFNRAGFTHIRDMTSNLETWQLHGELLDCPDFTLHVEHWFSCERLEDLQKTINDAIQAKNSEGPLRKIRGIKIFADGSLGSSTALLSEKYKETESFGTQNWSNADLKCAMKLIWNHHLEMAVHSLGDQMTHHLVKIARELYAKGHLGKLHLEHTEVLRPETIQTMKSLHVRCHLQPCHWFSDQKWISEKIGDLEKFAFPWSALEKAQVPFSFGSDSPIEETGFLRNLEALEKSQRPLKNSPLQYHVYPYQDAPEGITWIEKSQVRKIRLADRILDFT